MSDSHQACSYCKIANAPPPLSILPKVICAREEIKEDCKRYGPHRKEIHQNKSAKQ